MSINAHAIESSLDLVGQVSAPTSPTPGNIYYDSTLQKFRLYQNNVYVDLDSPTFVSTATSASTTTLISTSNSQQFFTGTATQNCTLPVATTLYNGWPMKIVNLSTGNVTVKTSDGTVLQIMLPNTQLNLTCSNNAGGTGTASWTWIYSPVNAGELLANPSGGVSGQVLTTPGGTGTPFWANAVSPAGSIIMFGGLNAPTGWVFCDGSALSRTTFSTLFAAITISTTGTNTSGTAIISGIASTTNWSPGMFVSGTGIPAGATILSVDSSSQIHLSTNTTSAVTAFVVAPHGVGDGSTTFNVPNNSGVFPRGVGSQTIGGVVYSSTLGSVANDAMQGHLHSISDPTHSHNLMGNAGGNLNNLTGATQIAGLGSATATGYVTGPPYVSNAATGITTTNSPTNDGTHGTPRTASETRPANVGLNFIVKI